jgi:protocatechuate 3,4-dioxygenase beta subunit
VRIKGNRQEPVQRIARTQDFELEPGHVIAGKVVGPDHAGMAGVQIEAMNSAGAIGSGGMTESAKNGEFLLEGLAEGIYTLRVTATNYDAAPLQRVETGNTNVVIELFELASVTGRVVDADGRPLSSFTVKARTSNEISPAYGAVLAQKAVKDSEGRFELTGLPEGSYVIEGYAEGYASSFSDPFAATQGLVASDIVVRMTRGGSLSGQILNAYDNAPIAGAEVSTHDNDYVDGDLWDFFGAIEPSAMTKAKVFTDERGRFSIDVLTPGLYQLHVRARDSATDYVKDVEIVEGQHTELPPRLLIKGATIAGIVYGRDGAVVSGSTVSLTPQDSLATGGRVTRSDGTGRFLIENVQPGPYELMATRPGGGSNNPFEALADMKHSVVVLTIEDAGRYEIELHLGPKRN